MRVMRTAPFRNRGGSRRGAARRQEETESLLCSLGIDRDTAQALPPPPFPLPIPPPPHARH